MRRAVLARAFASLANLALARGPFRPIRGMVEMCLCTEGLISHRLAYANGGNLQGAGNNFIMRQTNSPPPKIEEKGLAPDQEMVTHWYLTILTPLTAVDTHCTAETRKTPIPTVVCRSAVRCRNHHRGPRFHER